MKKNILILFSYLLCFEISTDFGTFIIDSEIITKPFQGGFNKPKIQWLDWDNDGDDDLFILDEDGQIKFFENSGTCFETDNYSCSFNLITTSFQEINGISWFYIADFDLDGDFDMVTQNPNDLNQLLFYNNDVNTLTPIGIISDYQDDFVISDPVMTPTFADIDNDGDLDFFTGNVLGTITFYENIGFIDEKPKFNFISEFWEEIYIIGSSFSQRHGASAINFIDLDNDNDLDLCWGDFYQQSLYVVWNYGTIDNPSMDNVNITTQFPFNTPVQTAGLNMPSFSDIDNDMDMDLFVTVLSGAYGYQLINNFFFYEKVDDFVLKTSNFIQTLDFLSDINPVFIDIDNDNDNDLFVGTDFDPSTLPWIGKILMFENIGTDQYNQPIWTYINDNLFEGNLGNNLSINFADIDSDQDFDAFIGNYNGMVQFHENVGTMYSPNFLFIENINNIDLSGYSSPLLIDLDYDSDFDLLVGNIDGTLFYYNNIGDPFTFNFSLISDNFQSIDVGSRSSPTYYDFDGDNDLDLLIGSGNENIHYYKNNSNENVLLFDRSYEFDFPLLGLNTSPEIFFNEDYLGIVVGVSTGGMFYLNSDNSLAGDINSDSFVNIYDIVLLIEHIIGNYNYYGILDLNNDYQINILDVIILIDLIFLTM